MYDDKTAADDRVTTLFHDTTADVEVDVAELVRGGIARGRAKHRLHTIGTAFAAAVGVAGIVGVALPLATSTSGNGIAPAGAPAPAVTSTKATAVPPKGKPSDKPLPPPPAEADIPVKAANLPGAFAHIFPGKITQAEKRTGRIIDDGKQAQIAHFLWDGFLVSAMFDAYRGTPAERCEEIRVDAASATRRAVICTERPDGTFLVSTRGEEPAVDGGGKANSATLITKDHYEITVMAYTYGRKGGPNLSPQPPLSEAQLKHAVTSHAWF
ncbi:hypothetical protein GCM10009745_33410 [Kribbella yunnanensis]|uniref:Uncharacterized protein n=1 Tax=Kribbella yunnanensis TaxID=190194 RepID=A0ABP4TD85_9ACTN